MQLSPESKPNDHTHRHTFADWTLEQLEADPAVDQKIMFSDEAHFWLSKIAGF